jgi:hypothetical protein
MDTAIKKVLSEGLVAWSEIVFLVLTGVKVNSHIQMSKHAVSSL